MIFRFGVHNLIEISDGTLTLLTQSGALRVFTSLKSGDGKQVVCTINETDLIRFPVI